MFLALKGEIKKKGLTLEDIAKELGITLSTLSLKLNGKYPITLNEAKKIKEILGVDTPLEELFEEAN